MGMVSHRIADAVRRVFCHGQLAHRRRAATSLVYSAWNNWCPQRMPDTACCVDAQRAAPVSCRKALKLGKFLSDVDKLRKLSRGSRTWVLQLVAAGGEVVYLFLEQVTWWAASSLLALLGRLHTRNPTLCVPSSHRCQSFACVQSHSTHMLRNRLPTCSCIIRSPALR